MFCVSSLTSSALVDMGDALLPKYAPNTMAPPRITESAPSTEPEVMLITPIVAAVPNTVPVSIETPIFRAAMTNRINGTKCIFPAAQGMVPLNITVVKLTISEYNTVKMRALR